MCVADQCGLSYSILIRIFPDYRYEQNSGCRLFVHANWIEYLAFGNLLVVYTLLIRPIVSCIIYDMELLLDGIPR